MTKYFKLLATLLFLIFQFNISFAPGGTVFNDPQGCFSLDLGTGWTQMPTQSTEEMGHFAYIQNGIVAAEMSIASETLPMALSPLQYAQASEQNGLVGLPQYQKLQERTLPWAGQEIAYLQFNMAQTTQTGQNLMTMEMYFLVIQNRGIVITLTSLANQFGFMKSVFDAAIQTLQLSARTATLPTANMPYMNPPTPSYPQTPMQQPTLQQDPNALYQQYQQQQQQQMQQFMQMYAKQNAPPADPYAMPSGDAMNQMIQTQMQMATLTPPPLTMSPQSQQLMNPQTIPTYPMTGQTGQPTLQNAPQGTMIQPQAPLPTVPPTPGPRYNSYQEPGGHFALLIPETFSPMQASAGQAFQGPQGQVIHAGIVPSVEDTLKGMTQDKEILDQRDPQVLAGTKRIPGKLIIYASINPQTGQKFVITALGVPERNLLVTFTTPEAQFEKDADTVIQVIRSVDVHE